MLTVLIILQTDWGQNWLAKRITNRLSRDLQTRVSIKHVDFSFFNKMNLEGVLIEDRKQDTLLFAGNVQLRITDWFFFKEKAEIKYIGLEDAVIKFNRTDSTWNYKFLSDYFAPAPGKKPKKDAGIELQLKVADFKNILFIQEDAWNGQDLIAKFKQLNLDADAMTITGSEIDINNLSLIDPEFKLINYTKRKPNTIAQEISDEKPEKIDSLLQWNSMGLALRIKNLSLSNGRFQTMKKSNSAPLPYFDGVHIDFHHIDGKFTNVQWLNDTIQANLSLATKERSGFVVKKLEADFKFHPNAMIFQNLDLQTNNSHLKDYYAMRFEKFSDMGDYIHKVRMEASFTEADIDSDDIGFFAPELRKWKKNILLSGKIRGTVDDIKGDGLVVRAGNNTYLNGDVTLSGLPNIDQTFIDFRANEFKTTYGDAVTFLPKIRRVRTPDLARIRYLNFTGSFTGFVRDFVTYGTISTNLGTVRSDLNMKLPDGRDPIYSGTIATNNFALGPFIRSPKIGSVAVDATVRGTGFDPKTLSAQIDGKIRSLQYNNYTYQNMVARGKLNRQQFDGFFSINDPNAELTMNGVVDFGRSQPFFDLVADIKRANLRALNISKDDIAFNGKFNLRFAGDNIDNFLGDAKISGASLTRNGIPLSFDSLTLSSRYVDGVKTLVVNTNEFDGTIRGEFNVATLPQAFRLFLNKYYPAYIPAPVGALRNQSFTFDIVTRNVDEYITLVDPNLSGFSNSTISGRLDMLSNQFTLEANVPRFGYKQYLFSEAIVKGDGNLDRLVLTGDVGDVFIGDSIRLPETKFSIESKNDISQISISTTANQAINQASLAAQVQTFSDGVKLRFDSSSFVLNNKTWSIQQGGELEFRRNSVAQGELVLSEGVQEIRLATVPSPLGNWNDLEIALKNLNLGDLSPFLLKKNRVEGVASGSIYVEDPQRKMLVTSDIRADELRLDNDSIGSIAAKVSYDRRTGRITGPIQTLDPERRLDVELDLMLNDTANIHRDRISITPTNYPVQILNRFIGTLFSDLQGFVTGKLDIIGEGSDMRYVGKGRLRDAGLKVNFTQVFYKILDTEIELKEDAIDFGSITLVDTITKNTATLRGSIQHEGFRNMFYDIFARVDDQPVQLLNTTAYYNQQFYGRATGTGSLSLTGPQSNMFMDISVRASETDSSYITLPSATTRESGRADFLVERKYGREMTGDDITSAESNINYEVNLIANPLVNMEVILDDLTGDIIKGRGNGNLFISSGTNEPLYIRGRYNLTAGEYKYTFQSLFKKPFVLNNTEENYIEWTGDPYEATMNIEATYVAKQVSFQPLSSLPGLASNISRNREDVHVIAKLTGNLFRPKFDFRFEFPNSAVNNDANFAFNIQQIQSNLNELYKQVTYLIVFNSFAPIENTTLTGGTFNEFAYNTISGLLFDQVNLKLNQWLSKILQRNDITLNFSGSLYNRNLINPDATGGFDINQSNFNLTVGKSFFNDRFNISFGSTLDVPLQSTISQTIHYLPDVTMEWMINQSGSIRANFFYRENLDFLTGNANIANQPRIKRTGASLAYRKDFNALKDLFKKRKPKTVVPPPAATDSTGSN